MTDMVVLLALAALILGYASILIYMRLRAGGASPARIRLTLIELWVTFAVIIGVFALVRATLGEVGGGSVAEEFANQYARLREQSTGTQAVIILALLLALGLFIHLIWTLQKINQEHASPGGSHD